MVQPHIFVVEDEESLAETIALNLQLENYKVTIRNLRMGDCGIRPCCHGPRTTQ